MFTQTKSKAKLKFRLVETKGAAISMMSPLKRLRVFAIFIILVVISPGLFSFELYTEKFLTAVRGKDISLPCTFSVPALGVYWYKHAYTGAPDEDTNLVASDYSGNTDPVPGFERFSITKDYSLVIHNISVPDETTYSCVVFSSDLSDERGYTDLRVIVLADPLEPVIESCTVTAPGRCSFTISDSLPEQVHLVCKLSIVRPLPNLTWTDSDGRKLENADAKINEADGLFEVSSFLQVSVDNGDDQYFCQAEGEAVNGTLFMKVAFNVDVNSGSYHGLIIGAIISILTLILVIMVSMWFIMMKRNQRSLRTQAVINANCASTPLSNGSGSVQVSKDIETNKSSDLGEKPLSGDGNLTSFSESSEEPDVSRQKTQPIRGKGCSAQSNERSISNVEILRLSGILPNDKFLTLSTLLGFDYYFSHKMMLRHSGDVIAAFEEILLEWRDRGGLIQDLDDALQEAELGGLIQYYKN